ncbi:MAG: cyclin-dependent kinase inhibitor 3 family protein [Trueperaceae bacterium]|nr:cyclin-dependent kinase inhibitor 3 family protein [Trueperaceae bacterium]
MIHATSHTHPIRVDFVPTDPLPGRLGLTLAPGKKATSSVSRVRWDRDLDTDLQDLRQRFGTDVLVSLMRPYEHDLLEIPDLFPRAEAHSMRVRPFPIDDVSVPDARSADAFGQLIDELHAELEAGRTLTVHCRGGLGRSGLVAACLLVRAGLDAATAVRRVRKHRPGAIETRGQEAYVGAYADWLTTAPGATPET